MRCLYKFLVFYIVIIFISCNSNSSGDDGAFSSVSAQSNNSKSNYVAGKDYIEFERQRVMDNIGFAQSIEVSSFLIPKGWKLEGNVFWNLPGKTCEGTFQNITITSPDNQYQLKIFPINTWVWSDDPMINQFSQQTYGTGGNCIASPPIDAERFLRNILVPQLPNQAKIIKSENNNLVSNELKAIVEANNRELNSYGGGQTQNYYSALNAQIQFNDGYSAMVMIGMINSQMSILNQYNGSYNMQYSGILHKYISFKYPDGQEEQAKDILAVILESYKTNPNWSSTVNQYWRNYRAQKQVENVGRIKLIDSQTQAMAQQHQKNMQAKSQAFQQNVRSWETTQQTNDKIHNNFIKAIKEVDNFQDANGVVEMSSHYDQAWSRSDGSSFIMSNNPNFDPSSVFQDNRWEQMKKVP